MSKKVKEHIKMIIKAVILSAAVSIASKERGYRAVGGEFLLLPLMYFVRKIYLDVKEILSI